MDEHYKQLMIEMCRSATVAAEQVMEYDRNHNDEKGEKVAETMRTDYQSLEDKLKNNEILAKNDFLKLIAAAYIVSGNIQDKVNAYEKVIKMYKLDIIPKLGRIVNEANTEEEIQKLTHELLQVEKSNT